MTTKTEIAAVIVGIALIVTGILLIPWFFALLFTSGSQAHKWYCEANDMHLVWHKSDRGDLLYRECQ